MHVRVKRIGMIVLGWAFIVLGIIGLFLPVLQGVLFIAVGLMILSTEYVWAHHLVRKLLDRFPKLEQQLHRAPAWLRRFIPHTDGTQAQKHATREAEPAHE